METLKTAMEFCPHRIPLRGSIQGPAKPQAPRSLQVLATLPSSKPHGQMASGSGAKGAEGSGTGANILVDAIRGRKKPWWAPIFKFSSEINDDGGIATKTEGNDSGGVVLRKDRRATVFTDEKARLLRRESRATETWHDLMYHSAIATRMASPDHDSSS